MVRVMHAIVHCMGECDMSISRRFFLGQTAAASAATGITLSTNKTRAASAPSDKVVIGVMGLSRGQALATAFSRQPGVDVKYVCDVDRQRAAQSAKLLENAPGQCEPITNFRRILDDKEVDVLVCAPPNHWHAPATILACSAGKHVYVEKPCSHNAHEGELMVQAARQYQRAVQMGSQRRSSQPTQEAIQKLHGGVIGRVYLVSCFYNSVRGSIGKGNVVPVPGHIDYDLWQGPAPRKPYLSNVVHYKWHWRWHWGNGELGNNGIHSIDLARWGLDVDYPLRVTSSGGRYCFDDDQETPDTHLVSFEFAGKRAITWRGLSCHRHGAGFVSFYGDKGALDISSDGSYKIFDIKNKLIDDVQVKGRGGARHIDNFLTAIRNDTPLALNAEILGGHQSTLLCHLGNIAQRTGKTLDCDTKNGRILNDTDAAAMWKREYEPGWEPQV